jgi:hypothetical protein
MPWAHNLIEAMAVGSSPITNYGHLLRPPLEDGRTCFAFGSRVSLEEALRRACSASERELARMRRDARHLVEHVVG